MTAKQLPFSKRRLMDVSRELYLQHGWDMPKGLIDQSARNPLNFSRAEWQQAARAKQDPRMVKALFKDAWKRSDSPESLKAALEQRGYYLARGDRRGVVAVDYRGEAYALSRWAGVKAKDVKARFGAADTLPSVENQRIKIASLASENLRRQARQIGEGYKKLRPSAEYKRIQMMERHKADRRGIAELQKARLERETANRAARLPENGLGKLWSRITGKYSKLKAQNEHDAWQSLRRDQAERDKMIARQLDERQRLQQSIRQMREDRVKELMVIRQEIANYMLLKQGKALKFDAQRSVTDSRKTPIRSKERPRQRDDQRQRTRDRGHDRDDGPGF